MDFILDVLLFFIILTYLAWGFIFGIHAMLVISGSKSAKKWARFWYTPKGYVYECYIFFPMIYFVFLLVEFLPAVLGFNDDYQGFDFEKIKDTCFFDERW